MSDHETGPNGAENSAGGEGGGKTCGKQGEPDRAHNKNSAAAHCKKSDNNPGNANERRWWQIGWDRAVELAFTFAIMAATINQCTVANRQWSTMVESNNISREFFTSVQRAFVSVKEIAINLRPEETAEGKWWDFNVVFHNSGNTPTKNMKYLKWTPPDEINRSGTDPRRHTPPDQEEGTLKGARNSMSEDQINDLIWSNAFIAPQTDFRSPVTAVSAESLGLVSKGKWGMFIQGVARYRDVFPGTDEHVSKFCFRLMAISKDGELFPDFFRCKHHNCADEECQRDERAYQKEICAYEKTLPPSARPMSLWPTYDVRTHKFIESPSLPGCQAAPK